jgi:hypothetical protein
MVWRRIKYSGWTESQALGVKPPPKGHEKYLRKRINVDGMKLAHKGKWQNS